jgi:molybdenum cofactor synthesis domain-containing protein
MSTDYTAAVITLSDLGSRGERADTSGPALCEILKGNGWNIVHTAILPDDIDLIKAELIRCADELGVCLVVTTGGTGFSRRDVTPEATKAVIERECPGIPEAMRAESLRITPRGCLSREAAGIRGETLIVNCPGSEKAARECIGAVLPALKHGIEMLRGWKGNCAGTEEHRKEHSHHGG